MNNYVRVSHEEEEKTKKVLTVFGIISGCIVIIIVIWFLSVVLDDIRVNKMKKKYIEPYLKENYKASNYSIKYKNSGKCITSGDCSYDFFKGWDNSARFCNEYRYLDEKECTSYYYYVSDDNSNFILTLVYRDNKYYVVEGKNIYGKDKKNDDVDDLKKN